MCKGGLCRFVIDTTKHEALVHDSGKLWHKHLGHLHYGSLPLLKVMVQGLANFKIEKINVCKGCALGKHTKTAFTSNEQRSRDILELIHSNVCGPMSSSSFKLICIMILSSMIPLKNPRFIL